MRRKYVERKSSDIDIQERIERFISLLKEAGDDARRIKTICQTERKWLGEGREHPRYSINTRRSFFTEYKRRIRQELPVHESFDKAFDRLVKRFPEDMQPMIEADKTPENLYNIRGQMIKQLEDAFQVTTPLYEQLKKLRIPHRAHDMMKVRSGESTLVKLKGDEKLTEGKKNKVSISKAVILDAVSKGIQKELEPEKKSIYRLLVALMLCSGRRPIELLRTGKMKPKTKNSMIFEGQAKKRHGLEADPYEIPVLHITAKEFVKYLGELRNLTAHYSEKTNQEINATISSDASDTARKLLLNDDAVLYTCRSAYAAWVAEELNKDEDRDIVIARIMGHEKNDTKTAGHYEMTVLTSELLAPAAEEYRKQLSSKRPKVKALGREKSKPVKLTREKRSKAQQRQKEMEGLIYAAIDLGRAARGIHEWALDYLKINPDVEFTQTLITKEKGASRPAIKKWMTLIESKGLAKLDD